MAKASGFFYQGSQPRLAITLFRLNVFFHCVEKTEIKRGKRNWTNAISDLQVD
jgi:hypothetical protein